MGDAGSGAIKLRIAFKIVNTQDGLTAQMQSPDQSPTWVTATDVKRDGAAFIIEVKGMAPAFEGKIAADLNSIDGTFTQGAAKLPLQLKRVKDKSASSGLARRTRSSRIPIVKRT